MIPRVSEWVSEWERERIYNEEAKYYNLRIMGIYVKAELDKIQKKY